MQDNSGGGGDSSPERFEQVLLQKIKQIDVEPEIRAIAERLRVEAISEIEQMDGKCVDKQKLISSLKVVRGTRPGEVLVVSEGEYGANIEFGTKNSVELPFLFPSFNKLGGLIHKCLQGALNRATLKAR